jgi:hypothetical protein
MFCIATPRIVNCSKFLKADPPKQVRKGPVISSHLPGAVAAGHLIFRAGDYVRGVRGQEYGGG